MSLTIDPATTHHYDIEVATLEEVVAAVDDEEAGTCSYTMRYAYSGTDRRGYPIDLDVFLVLSIRLPRWTGREAARPEERAEWDRFYQALVDHENGHAVRIREGARRAYDRMEQALARDLDEVFERGKRRIDQENRAFDSATDHGRRPPPGTTITIP